MKREEFLKMLDEQFKEIYAIIQKNKKKKKKAE